MTKAKRKRGQSRNVGVGLIIGLLIGTLLAVLFRLGLSSLNREFSDDEIERMVMAAHDAVSTRFDRIPDDFPLPIPRLADLEFAVAGYEGVEIVEAYSPPNLDFFSIRIRYINWFGDEFPNIDESTLESWQIPYGFEIVYSLRSPHAACIQAMIDSRTPDMIRDRWHYDLWTHTVQSWGDWVQSVCYKDDLY
ncbi:MAG: hypothetical protein H6670_14075 [Anaerolineaceae bacterium]|nr:hypothetical protein [Anaerolineaceae bacterium]